VAVSDEKTLPLLPFLADHRHDDLLPPGMQTPSSFAHMSDGTEWLESFRRTADFWSPLLFSGERIVCVHVLLFGDGIQLFRYNQQGFEVITSTLGEFNHGALFFSFLFFFFF
jgi:hypothetical protein